MPATGRPRLIFLLALTGRSGTNYLFNLLRHHPLIARAPTPFWEDYVLHESHHLRAFADGVFSHWNRIARVLATSETKGDLECALGETICRFLTRNVKDPFVIAKTPSIQNLDLVHRFFPDEKLIIILRDGRDVVASSIRSYGWVLEEAAAAWADAADELQTFCAQVPADRRLIVHFEQLVRDPKLCLDNIFTYVGADPSRYNWRAMAFDKVIGSSDLIETDGKIHWWPVNKSSSFNPIGRWQAWTDDEKRQFDERAGRQLEALRSLV